MIGFIDALRMELMHDHTAVSVTTVLPASINTPFFDKSLTRLGVKPRPIPPVYEPSQVAKVILDAAEHPVREVYVGGAGKSLGLFQKVSPGLADRIFSRIGYRSQMTDQPKSDQAPSNLYGHLEGYDRVQGSFSEEAKPISVYTGLSTRPALRWAVMAVLAGVGLTLVTRRRSTPRWMGLATQLTRLLRS